MSGHRMHVITPSDVLRSLWIHRRALVISTVACGTLAVGYALFAPRYWEASQGMVVRQEAVGAANDRPGKFADLYEMRTLQETILELVKSRQVIESAFRNAHADTAPARCEFDNELLEETRKRIKMLPPHGAEFGKTEVFYLSVENTDRQVAIRFVSELSRQLDLRLRQLREDRAHGLIKELEQQVEIAAGAHTAQTKRLEEFESGVGADLGELRLLHSANSGQSDLRQQLVTLQQELRRYEANVRGAQQLISQLNEARQAPEKLIATPNSLLVTQPALRRLKDGLVDAQLETARLRGTRSDEHPLVIAARESEARIRNDLFRELASAIESAQAELQLDRHRRDDLSKQLVDVRERLNRLAEHRAEYSNRVAGVDNSRRVLDEARQRHSDGLAALAAASKASLVTPIDRPDTGPHPVGPSRSSVVLLSALGGLVLGCGWIFLTAEYPASGLSQRVAAVNEEECQDMFDTTAPSPLVTPVTTAPTAGWVHARPLAGVGSNGLA